MNIQIEGVKLAVIASDRQEADSLITACEASAAARCLSTDLDRPEIIFVLIEDVNSVKEAVAVFAGIAATIGIRPSSIFLDRVGGIQGL